MHKIMVHTFYFTLPPTECKGSGFHNTLGVITLHYQISEKQFYYYLLCISLIVRLGRFSNSYSLSKFLLRAAYSILCPFLLPIVLSLLIFCWLTLTFHWSHMWHIYCQSKATVTNSMLTGIPNLECSWTSRISKWHLYQKNNFKEGNEENGKWEWAMDRVIKNDICSNRSKEMKITNYKL